MLRIAPPRQLRRRLGDSRFETGQSFVEFALILPVLLLLTLVALDFGRIYLGWVNLQNLTRIAANFAANHPEAWLTGEAPTITQYNNQIISDASATNCQLTPTTPDSPVFTDMNGDGLTTGLGDHATVTLTCRFQVLTPVISNIVGSSLPVTATAAFPVKTGLTGDVGGVDWTCLPPTADINADPASGGAPLSVRFSDASGGGEPDSWIWDFGDETGNSLVRDPGNHVYEEPGTYLATLTSSNVCGSSTTDPGRTIVVIDTGATEPPKCVVPNFVSPSVRRNYAQPMWQAAGFSTTIIDGPGHPMGNYSITYQSLTAGNATGGDPNGVDCGATIVVNAVR